MLIHCFIRIYPVPLRTLTLARCTFISSPLVVTSILRDHRSAGREILKAWETIRDETLLISRLFRVDQINVASPDRRQDVQ